MGILDDYNYYGKYRSMVDHFTENALNICYEADAGFNRSVIFIRYPF